MQEGVPDEATIVAYLQKDNAQAQKAMSWLIDSYGRRLFASIKRWTNSNELTNDILQDVFILIWRHRLSFKGNSSLFAWMYRIAYNETLQTLRKEKKHLTTEIHDGIVALNDSSYSQFNLSSEEISNLLLEAIALLPEKQRLVFEIKYFEDLKYEEIANTIGGTIGGLKANYFHATQKIEQFLLSKLTH